MSFTLHAFQARALGLYELSRDDERYLIASPTGTGKSYMILRLRELIPDSWVVTPRVEIIRGLLCKLGYNAELYSLTTLIETAWKLRITTPMRLRNVMLKGDFTETISLLIWDEVHHHLAETWALVDLMSGCPSVGFTATPFRGTPKESAIFRELWGEPHWAITYIVAAREGYLQIPTVCIEPLIDDDVVKIVAGEFEIESLESEIESRMDDVVRMISGFTHAPGGGESFLEVDIPTMVSVPSSKILHILRERLLAAGVTTVGVTQETNQENRQLAFKLCVECRAILVQIDVVSEGVDLPIKRLIDLHPTLSPVEFLQRLGRITRPGGVQPEYVCCNRNLLRHAYLLEGLIPISKLVEAQESFPPTVRATAVRAIGLEAIGRFKPVTVRLANGLEAVFYSLSAIDNGKRIDYSIILHPAIAKPLVARKTSLRDGDTTHWGKWFEVYEPLTELTGFQSITPKSISEKQRAWWLRSAKNFGLDELQKVDAKKFQILPVLADLRKVIR